MDYLSWDLAILSRAVAYSNLSAASANIGISQPQLSRIVAKLEEQLGVVLLDRETKRKSSWTPAATRLAEIYKQTYQNFSAEVGKLSAKLEPVHLRIGTLEGLTPLSMKFCHKLFEQTDVMVVELNVYDTNDLEEHFLKNEVDLIFTSRQPGRKKYRHHKQLGYQTIELSENGSLQVLSYYEYATMAQKNQATERMLVSNSLLVRKNWLDKFGGTGTLPSSVRPDTNGRKDEVPVVVLAHDTISPKFWETISGLL